MGKSDFYFIDKYSYIDLYNSKNEYLGHFDVWHDAENMEYITYNGIKILIESIDEKKL